MIALLESPKAHTGIKRQGSRQRITMIESEGNPMAQATDLTDDLEKESVVKVENLSDAKLITSAEFETLMNQIRSIEDNVELLLKIELLKLPYLFASVNLLKILDLTPSVKTRLSIIGSIGPRLTDPTARSDELTSLFRYSQDQAIVTEVLKQRQHTLQASRFKQTSNLNRGSVIGGGARGGAGRGAGGRQSVTIKVPETESVSDKVRAGAVSKPVPVEGSHQDTTDDNVTDVEQSSERSAGSPGEGLEEHSSNSTQEPEPFNAKKRTTSFVVKSRRVTLKTAAEIHEEKIAAAAAHLHEPKPAEPAPAPAPAPPPITAGRSKSVIVGGPAARGAVTLQSHAPTHSDQSKVTASTRKIIDSKGWMKKPDTSEGSSDPAANGSVARKLFSQVDGSETGDRRPLSIDTQDSGPGAILGEKGMTVREFVRRNSGDVAHAPLDWKRGPLSRSVSERVDSESIPDTDSNAEITASQPSRRSTYAFDTPRQQSLPLDFAPGTVRVSEISRAYLSSGVKSNPGFGSSSGWATPGPGGPGATPTPARRRISGSDTTTSAPMTASKPSTLTSSSGQGLDSKYLSSLEPSEPLAFGEDGTPFYSYIELVRRNFLKSYGELTQTELERYLTDAEFIDKMGLSRGDFYNLPKWKQVSQKKALLLF